MADSSIPSRLPRTTLESELTASFTTHTRTVLGMSPASDTRITDIEGRLERGASGPGTKVLASIIHAPGSLRPRDLQRVFESGLPDAFHLLGSISAYMLPLPPDRGLLVILGIESIEPVASEESEHSLLRELLRLFGPACSYAIHQPAYPGLEELEPRAHREAAERVQRYWQRLGFQVTSDFGDMVVNLVREFKDFGGRFDDSSRFIFAVSDHIPVPVVPGAKRQRSQNA